MLQPAPVPAGETDIYAGCVREALTAAGHNCVVFAMQESGAGETTGRPTDPVAARLWYAPRLFRDHALDARLRGAIKTEQPDLVFSIHPAGSLPAGLPRIVTREHRLPLVQFLGDNSLFCPALRFRRRNGRDCQDCIRHPVAAVARRCIRHSMTASLRCSVAMARARRHGVLALTDGFVCASRRLADLLAARRIPAANIHHASLPAADLGPADQCLVPHCRDYVLYCGPIDPDSGVETLLRAFVALGRRAESLFLAGPADPRYLQHLQQIGAELGRRLRIMPAQSATSRARLLQGARLVAHPALWHDQLPVHVAEARAAGRAVLASRVGVLPQLVADREDGWLVEPGHLARWSEALAGALTDNRRPDMERLARRRYEVHHQPSRHATALLELFGRLQGRHRAMRFDPGMHAA